MTAIETAMATTTPTTVIMTDRKRTLTAATGDRR